MTLSVRACLASLTAVASLLASAALSVYLHNALPFGIAMVLASALGVSSVFDAVAAVAVERRWSSAAWLLITLIAGGSAALFGVAFAAAVIAESVM